MSDREFAAEDAEREDDSSVFGFLGNDDSEHGRQPIGSSSTDLAQQGYYKRRTAYQGNGLISFPKDDDYYGTLAEQMAKVAPPQISHSLDQLPPPEEEDEEPLNDLDLIAKLRLLYPLEEKGNSPGVPFIEEENPRWNYVNSKRFRAYQFEICRKSLVSNTLVCLPTGLGKTFIALNVIINYHRWFPNGKLFFLAPTKPLVGQQIESLREVGRIKEEEMAHLDGTTSQSQRQQAYVNKRVFFMTPQTMENDLSSELIDRSSIVLLVLDEAHRATGRYSYTEIVRTLLESDVGFRVVALTATPANTFTEIQDIISNLAISNIEIRRDDDSDVRKYLQSKQLTPVVVQATGKAARVEESLRAVIRWIWTILRYNLKGPEEQEVFRRIPEGRNYYDFQAVSNSFKRNKSYYKSLFTNEEIGALYSALSLFLRFAMVRKSLSNTGFEVFKRGFEDIKQKFMAKAYNKFLKELKSQSCYANLEVEVDRFNKAEGSEHPKMSKLYEIMREFSARSKEAQSGSKCIVFTSTRNSAFFIKQGFDKNLPEIKAKIFVGQKRTNKDDPTSIVMSQKGQLQILNDFRARKIDVLIATCVAEEGLDVTEVDLIVCYDGGLNPTRLLQRIGRTGRKRAGQIYLLLTQHESEKYYAAIKQYDSTVEELKNSNVCVGDDDNAPFKFYERNPRMIPLHIKTIELEMLLSEGIETESNNDEAEESPEKPEPSPKEPKRKRVSKHNRDPNSMKMTQFFQTLPAKYKVEKVAPIVKKIKKRQTSKVVAVTRRSVYEERSEPEDNYTELPELPKIELKNDHEDSVVCEEAKLEFMSGGDSDCDVIEQT